MSIWTFHPISVTALLFYFILPPFLLLHLGHNPEPYLGLLRVCGEVGEELEKRHSEVGVEAAVGTESMWTGSGKQGQDHILALVLRLLGFVPPISVVQFQVAPCYGVSWGKGKSFHMPQAGTTTVSNSAGTQACLFQCKLGLCCFSPVSIFSFHSWSRDSRIEDFIFHRKMVVSLLGSMRVNRMPDTGEWKWDASILWAHVLHGTCGGLLWDTEGWSRLDWSGRALIMFLI